MWANWAVCNTRGINKAGRNAAVQRSSSAVVNGYPPTLTIAYLLPRLFTDARAWSEFKLLLASSRQSSS